MKKNKKARMQDQYIQKRKTQNKQKNTQDNLKTQHYFEKKLLKKTSSKSNKILKEQVQIHNLGEKEAISRERTQF